MKTNKQFITSLFFLIFSYFNLFSQKKFEKGYFIDNNGQKNECLIKTFDFETTPFQFSYKFSEDSPITELTTDDVKEFSIYEKVKFIKADVNIDLSSDNVDNLSILRNPEFVKRSLFLKVLVEGKASLFYYNDNNVVRFFYNLEGKDITQLIYKRFLNNEDYTKVSTNDTYKQQIINDLNCEGLKKSEIENTEYKNDKISNIFLKYNTFFGIKNKILSEKEIYKTFELYFKSGISHSVFNFNYYDISNSYDKTKLRFAIESEFNLSRIKKKWSIIFEAAYQNFKAKNLYFNRNSNIDINYKSIDLSIGLKHYFSLNQNSRLFIDLYYDLDISMNSEIAFEKYYYKRTIPDSVNPSIGFGYSYKKYAIEFKYDFNRYISYEEVIPSNYHSTSLSLTYKFL